MGNSSLVIFTEQPKLTRLKNLFHNFSVIKCLNRKVLNSPRLITELITHMHLGIRCIELWFNQDTILAHDGFVMHRGLLRSIIIRLRSLFLSLFQN